MKKRKVGKKGEREKEKMIRKKDVQCCTEQTKINRKKGDNSLTRINTKSLDRMRSPEMRL